jgi:hypothetical protein
MIFLTQIYYIKHAGCSISLCSQDTKRTLEVGKSPGWNNGLQLVWVVSWCRWLNLQGWMVQVVRSCFMFALLSFF